MNKIIDDERCRISQEECSVSVKEYLERLAQDNKYSVRTSVEGGGLETRFVVIIAAVEVAIMAYLLHKLATASQPQKLDVTWYTGGPLGDHRSIAVDIPLAEYDPSTPGGQVTSISSTVRDRWVLIQTSLATDSKGCSSLSEALVAIATPEPVMADLSPYDADPPLPGWFQVAVSPDKDQEIRQLQGVEDVVADVGSAQSAYFNEPAMGLAAPELLLPEDVSNATSFNGLVK